MRSVDGLDMPARKATEFEISFASQDLVMRFRTNTPQARARFLWALSRTFAKRLRRAPPARRLKLLELQEVVETSGPPTEAVPLMFNAKTFYHDQYDGRTATEDSGTDGSSLALGSSQALTNGGRTGKAEAGQSGDVDRRYGPRNDSSNRGSRRSLASIGRLLSTSRDSLASSTRSDSNAKSRSRSRSRGRMRSRGSSASESQADGTHSKAAPALLRVETDDDDNAESGDYAVVGSRPLVASDAKDEALSDSLSIEPLLHRSVPIDPVSYSSPQPASLPRKPPTSRADRERRFGRSKSRQPKHPLDKMKMAMLSSSSSSGKHSHAKVTRTVSEPNRVGSLAAGAQNAYADNRGSLNMTVDFPARAAPARRNSRTGSHKQRKTSTSESEGTALFSPIDRRRGRAKAAGDASPFGAQAQQDDIDAYVDGPMAMRHQTSPKAPDKASADLPEYGKRDLAIDRRAFLMAASRMGGLADELGESPTAALRKRQQEEEEKRAFRMDRAAIDDLDAVVTELFSAPRAPVGGSVSSRTSAQSPTVGMSELEEWLRAEIARAETSNMEETLAVERDAPALAEPLRHIKESLSTSDGWLRKCESLLAGHAQTVEALHLEIEILETQRRNTDSLYDCLETLLDNVALTPAEEDRADSVLRHANDAENMHDLAPGSVFFITSIVPVAYMLARKSRFVPEDPALLNMKAFAEERTKLLEKRAVLIDIVMPLMLPHAAKLARAPPVPVPDSATLSDPSLLGVVEAEGTNASVRSFRIASHALGALDEDAVGKLVDAYVRESAASKNSKQRMFPMAVSSHNRRSVTAVREDVRHAVSHLTMLCLTSGGRVVWMFGGTGSQDGVVDGTLFARILDPAVNEALQELDDRIESYSKRACALVWTVYLELEAQIDAVEAHTRRLVQDGTKLAGSGAVAEAGLGSDGADASGLGAPRKERERDGMFQRTTSRTSTGSSASGVLGDDSPDAVAIVARSLTYLADKLRGVSKAYRAKMDVRIGEAVCVTLVRHPTESDAVYRKNVFSAVRGLIKLCCDLVDCLPSSLVSDRLSTDDKLSSPQLPPSAHAFDPARASGLLASAKTFCNRLIAAAMRTTENSSTPGPGRRPDIVKLECYAYMSLRLVECSSGLLPDLFQDVLPLAERGRRHACAAWTERMARTYFGAIFDAAVAAGSASALHDFETVIAADSPPKRVAQTMRSDMLSSFSPGARSANLDHTLWAVLKADIVSRFDRVCNTLSQRGLTAHANALLAYRARLQSSM